MCQGGLNNLIVLQFIRFQEFGQYCYFFYCEVEFVLFYNILDIIVLVKIVFCLKLLIFNFILFYN